MASQRLQQVSAHLAPSLVSASKIGVKSPEDVVVVSALRTAITRARKGGFKDSLPEGKLRSSNAGGRT
jgi:acetyl-CoA acyltransferase 1